MTTRRQNYKPQEQPNDLEEEEDLDALGLSMPMLGRNVSTERPWKVSMNEWREQLKE